MPKFDVQQFFVSRTFDATVEKRTVFSVIKKKKKKKKRKRKTRLSTITYRSSDSMHMLPTMTAH